MTEHEKSFYAAGICPVKTNLDGLRRICYYMDISLHCSAPLGVRIMAVQTEQAMGPVFGARGAGPFLAADVRICGTVCVSCGCAFYCFAIKHPAPFLWGGRSA